jgi:phage major head subunit gpT-like protein
MTTSSSKLLSRDKLEAAYITYSTIFDMMLASTPVIYPKIATVMNGVGPVTAFKWLGNVPVMTEWQGERKIDKLRAEQHELRTKWYANGIELDYDDLAEDKLGIVRPRIEDLAKMGPRKMDALVIDFYVNGFAGTLGLTYDGQYLFDTDHTYATADGQTSQSNLETGAISSTTFNAAIQKMMAFKDERGEPLEVRPDTLMVGYANQLAARKMLTQGYTAVASAGMESNIDYQAASLIINQRITDTKWFLLSLEMAVRAVILGIEFPPEFAALMGWDQRDQFMTRNALAGAHMKIGLAYGHWAAAVGSLGT